MIRLKNIDTNVHSGKKYEQTALTWPIAVSNRLIFVAPVDCKVETVDIYSVASAGCCTIVAYVGSLTTSLVAGLSTSAIDGTYNRNRLTATGGNDVTAGTPLSIAISATAANSAAHVMVTYQPLKHRSNR